MKTSAIVADRPPDVKEIHIVWMTTVSIGQEIPCP